MSDVLFDAEGNVRPIREVTLALIEMALKQNGGNISATAKQLGISRATMHRRIHDLKEKKATGKQS